MIKRPVRRAGGAGTPMMQPDIQIYAPSPRQGGNDDEEMEEEEESKEGIYNDCNFNISP